MANAPRWEAAPAEDDDAAAGRYLSLLTKGARLSPVLVVRASLEGTGRTLTVADGYHRICASYLLDPDAEVPCQIVDLPS